MQVFCSKTLKAN